jgi:Sister chromatid cohesion protein Dcc1
MYPLDRSSRQGLQKITMEELRRVIAASEEEIDSALEAALAVEIDGSGL